MPVEKGCASFNAWRIGYAPLILSSDLPAIDIAIEKSKVRERCLTLYPDREWLYDMIYESRFDRLWEQFRGGGGVTLGHHRRIGW